MLFINYDEGGGYYDHVPPPRGDPALDDTRACLGARATSARGYDRCRFRVRRLIVVSPWA